MSANYFYFLGKKNSPNSIAIRKDRMWRLEFSIAPEPLGYLGYSCPSGSWCIFLYLLESSLPIQINSLLIIPKAIPSSIDHHSNHENSSASASMRSQLPSISSNIKPIELKLDSKVGRCFVSLMGSNLEYA